MGRGGAALLNTLAPIILATMPHLLVSIVLASDRGVSTTLLALLAWNLVPVGVGALLLALGPRALGLAWLLTTTAASAFAAWAGAIAAHGAAGPSLFMWMPVCNLLLIGPAGAVVAAVVRRW